MVSSASLTNYDLKSTSLNPNKQASSVINAAASTANLPPFTTLKRNSFNSNKSNNNSPNINNNFSSKFNTFLSSNSSDFYFRTLLRYVRSASTENFKEKVRKNKIIWKRKWIFLNIHVILARIYYETMPCVGNIVQIE